LPKYRFLAADLVFKSTFDRAHGVHVFDLGPFTPIQDLSRLSVRFLYGDICVDPQGAVLHVAVRDADIPDDLPDPGHVIPGFAGGRHVRLGDDLCKGNTAPVVIYAGKRRTFKPAVRCRVDQFPRVFLEVKPGYPDLLLFSVIAGYENLSSFCEGKIILAYLVRLGKVGVEIILPVKDRVAAYLAGKGKAALHAEFHSFFVEHRECPRKSQAYGADVAVGLCTDVISGAGTEYLRGSGELHVYLKADHRHIHDVHQDLPPFPFFVQGAVPAMPRRRSSTAAALSSSGSPHREAIS